MRMPGYEGMRPDIATSPAEAFSRLVDDEDRWVRGQVTGDSNTPAEDLTNLIMDEDESVRTAAKANSNFPASVRATISLSE